MGGTKAGGIAARDTNIKKWGPNFYKIIGTAGGAAGRGHAFAHGKVDPSVAGYKGGKISTRKGVKSRRKIQ